MATRKVTDTGDGEATVRRYFELVSALRKGDAEAVDGLMDLWDPEGTFEFAGLAPLVGVFKGAMAISTLYQNRLKSSGMKFALEDSPKPDVHLGVVDTSVLKMVRKGGKIVVGWRTTVGTAEKRGFDESGSHEFQFRRGKIKKLRVRVAGKPRPSQLRTLSLADLSVRDIGRLSLAAWKVV